MSDAAVHTLLIMVSAAISAIFSAGIAWATFKRLQKDVNCMGKKINDINENALRRHHNVSMVLMLVAPAEKEREIVELMKEG